MKIKTKLTLGVGLLFSLIIVLSIVAIGYMNALKKDSENILVANYITLEYARNMLASLEDSSSKSLQDFEQNLQLQEKNNTEIGEAEATEKLRADFDLYKKQQADPVLKTSIRTGIFVLMDLNMQAIQRKSEIAKTTAEQAVFWISITGTFCFLIAFTLLINLPSTIANPIKELTDSIKQIALKKYSQRVHFEGHSEFGELATSFNTMAIKLQEYSNSSLAKLMMEKQRIETLINNMNDPVLGLDEYLNIIFVNVEALKVIGLKEQQVIGISAKDLAVNNDLVRSLIRDLLSVENGNITKPMKIYSEDKEGFFEKQTLHISITPTGESTKQIIGHVIILKNVTEYKELDFAKTNFISTVSHELKTPISSIKMSLQLLKNNRIGELNDEQLTLIESIDDDATRLLKITSELLNMAQVESGNIQLLIMPSSPKEMLLYAMNATKTQADQKQIKFDVDVPETLMTVQADNEKTAWVLTNLISNAIRYSYDNATIYLKIRQQDKMVKISVQDTGQGIAPEYKEKVFDRYFRVPGTKKEGTGLGLTISKEFIEAQGGKITVESEYGVGSTFSIVFNEFGSSVPSAPQVK